MTRPLVPTSDYEVRSILMALETGAESMWPKELIQLVAEDRRDHPDATLNERLVRINARIRDNG